MSTELPTNLADDDLTATRNWHVLVIEGEGDDREFSVECPGITEACQTWQKCPVGGAEEHEGLWEAEHPLAHGVEHKPFSFGWSVPWAGRCFVRDNDNLPAAVDGLGELPAGRYLLDWDVEDETDLTLTAEREPAPVGSQPPRMEQPR